MSKILKMLILQEENNIITLKISGIQYRRLHTQFKKF